MELKNGTIRILASVSYYAFFETYYGLESKVANYPRIVIDPTFNEEAFQKLLKDICSPSYTLTPKRRIETVNAIGLKSKRGKDGAQWLIRLLPVILKYEMIY